MSKKLSDIDNREYYRVPEGYFDKLPMQVRSRLDREGNRVRWYQLPPVRVAVPLVAAALVLAVLFFPVPTAETSAEKYLSDLSDEEMIEYLIESDLSYSELLTGIASEDILYRPTPEELMSVEEALIDDVDWLGTYELEQEDI